MFAQLLTNTLVLLLVISGDGLDFLTSIADEASTQPSLIVSSDNWTSWPPVQTWPRPGLVWLLVLSRTSGRLDLKGRCGVDPAWNDVPMIILWSVWQRRKAKKENKKENKAGWCYSHLVISWLSIFKTQHFTLLQQFILECYLTVLFLFNYNRVYIYVTTRIVQVVPCFIQWL